MISAVLHRGIFVLGLALAAGLALPAGAAPRELTLARRGQGPGYVIVLPENPSPSQVTASRALATCVAKMTGVRLPVETNTAPARAIFLGNGAESLGNDGFRLRADPPHFRIEGGRVHGTLFGVFDFLERYCGCGWFSPTTREIPKRESVTVAADLDDLQMPAFKLRDLNWTDHLAHLDFAATLKVNGFRIEYPESLGGRDHVKDTTTGGATFDVLCPPSKYGKDHPDWFSSVGGRRRVAKGQQRCLTNTGFLDFLVDQMRARIRANHPRCKYYSIYPNDCANYCECESCKALDDREGTPMATMLHMGNYVAERIAPEYPDVTILIFAYAYSRTPPKTMKVRDNVMICYCTDSCEFSKSLVASRHPGNAEFVRDFRRWRELTGNLYIWDYSANFKHQFLPFECCHVMPENFRLYRDVGVVGVFEEGDHYSVHCVDEALKTWIIGHLLWNPDQPLDPLLDRFFAGYYGAAAKVGRGYYDALVDLEMKRDETRGALSMCGGLLDDAFHPYAFFEEWSEKWTQALALVKDDPVRYENVYWARHAVDVVRLVRSRWAEKYSLRAGRFADDPKAAALPAIARRVLDDFDRVKGLNGFQDRREVRERVEMVLKNGTGGATDDGRLRVPAIDMRCEDPLDTKFVDDSASVCGKALRIDTTARDGGVHCIAFREYAVAHDPGVKIGLRVHARVERTGVKEGAAFAVGTSRMGGGGKRDIDHFRIPVSAVTGDGYAWYDVDGTWAPAGGCETIWIGNGERTDGTNRCVRAVYVDQIELIRK